MSCTIVSWRSSFFYFSFNKFKLFSFLAYVVPPRQTKRYQSCDLSKFFVLVSRGCSLGFHIASIGSHIVNSCTLLVSQGGPVF